MQGHVTAASIKTNLYCTEAPLPFFLGRECAPAPTEPPGAPRPPAPIGCGLLVASGHYVTWGPRVKGWHGGGALVLFCGPWCSGGFLGGRGTRPGCHRSHSITGGSAAGTGAALLGGGPSHLQDVAVRPAEPCRVSSRWILSFVTTLGNLGSWVVVLEHCGAAWAGASELLSPQTPLGPSHLVASCWLEGRLQLLHFLLIIPSVPPQLFLILSLSSGCQNWPEISYESPQCPMQT